MASFTKVLLIFCCCTFYAAQAQIKTSGIKTHYPGHSSGSLLLGNATEEHHFNGSDSYAYNRNFIPAETYRGGDWSNHEVTNTGEHYLGNSGVVGLVLPHTTFRPHIVLDPTAEFINKTRSAMASGVCYKEVPTSSLVSDDRRIPVGNGTTPAMSKIQICCDGYERNPHVYKRCDPICKDDCPNGICTAPNTCVCMPGHVRNYDDKCISTCPIGCGNGICESDNECKCKPGYTIEPVNRKFCIPKCEPACQHGTCVGPNKCDCFEGFRLTAAGACEPKCDNCENGHCTAPGFCSCNTGYLKVAGICEPVCALGCNKGRCAAPDVCECPNGFELDRSGANCVPHCELPCLNGVCDGANTCACNPGYILDEQQKNVCKPHCAQGCPNGYCTQPNFCVCKPGYIKSGIKGRQTCVPV
ncbi:fibrillin-2 [Teleopsis dalmanni]|uniref:fibrillin-2 n=1 Tax=Teleopsis dalmanni TaxID=139649 RepID=UPI0018CEF2EE|nr:fibrillin-2 [Teleopsis dalmanni]